MIKDEIATWLETYMNNAPQCAFFPDGLAAVCHIEHFRENNNFYYEIPVILKEEVKKEKPRWKAINVYRFPFSLIFKKKFIYASHKLHIN